jgi:5-methylcytosine-specific restriction enzyme A
MAKAFAIKFYQSSAWRNARRQALRRDCYTCADCGGRATEVHHIKELTAENIDDFDVALRLENLQSLCWDCHNKRTQKIADVAEGYKFDENGQVVKT